MILKDQFMSQVVAAPTGATGSHVRVGSGGGTMQQEPDFVCILVYKSGLWRRDNLPGFLISLALLITFWSGLCRSLYTLCLQTAQANGRCTEHTFLCIVFSRPNLATRSVLLWKGFSFYNNRSY